MVLLKRSLIAVSTVLLSVGLFTSCSDDGDDEGSYLTCEEAEAKLEECGEDNKCVETEICSSLACWQHYADEGCNMSGIPSGGSQGKYIGCFSAFTKLVLAECTVDDETVANCGAPTDASYKNCILTDFMNPIMDCAAEEGIVDEICEDASLDDCKLHYLEENLQGGCR